MRPLAAANGARTDEVLRIVIVGHVDHGKSTLVGRLFYETDSLPEGKFAEIKATCKKRGMPFEWAFLTDALQAERSQGITIDTAQIWFTTALRRYVLVDAPGHREFLRNMITGAAASDAALLLVDAKEGIKEQTRRHAYLLKLLGIGEVTALINKMDAVSYSRERFERISDELREFLNEIGVGAPEVIPISARHGDNIKEPSAKMGWWKGSTVLKALDGLASVATRNELPLRLPIQDVYKFDERRILVGRLESGELAVGDKLIFSPGDRSATVKSIENKVGETALAGENVGITLNEQLFVERGDIASHAESIPSAANSLRAKLFWLDKTPLKAGQSYRLRCATAESEATVESVENVINTDTLEAKKSDAVGYNQVAEVTLHTARTLAVDEYKDNPHNGKFVLFREYQIVGGGIISLEGYPKHHKLLRDDENIFAVPHQVTLLARTVRNRHRPGILWLTGLSASGKSTIALETEKQLFLKGYQVYALDGDNIRKGLSADLSFSPEDRGENIRRIAQVAGLFADAGNLVIVSCISPYRQDRRTAREVFPEAFHEVYIKASPRTCAERDPKGLYKKATSGELPNFSGVSAPYEEPQNPNLIIDTETTTSLGASAVLVAYAIDKFGTKK